MPRLLHVSDTHLGYQAYTRQTPDGLNQREVDAQEAFRHVVDAALADPPDLFLHTGDLFDHPRPTNRAIAFALQQVRRLSAARIATILISGNHDAPRLRETGSIFRVFEGLAHVRPVYAGGRERIETGGLVVHAVPQSVTQEGFHSELRAVDPHGGGRHVLAVHGTVLGVDGLFSSEFNEYQLSLPDLRPEFAYIALGHFHNVKRVAPNAWYAGSTESFSFNEAGTEKSYLDVEVDADAVRVRPRPTGARSLRDIPPIEADGSDPGAAFEAAARALREAPTGAIVRLTLAGLDRALARGLPWDDLKRVRSDLAHVELRLRFQEEATSLDGGAELGPLGQEFRGFCDRYPLPPRVDRGRVRDEALRLLAASEEPPRAA